MKKKFNISLIVLCILVLVIWILGILILEDSSIERMFDDQNFILTVIGIVPFIASLVLFIAVANFLKWKKWIKVLFIVICSIVVTVLTYVLFILTHCLLGRACP